MDAGMTQPFGLHRYPFNEFLAIQYQGIALYETTAEVG